MKTLQEIIKEKVEQKKALFVPPKNNCEQCAKCSEGKFCSPGCYYGTRFDYKGATISAYMEETTNYFNIPEEKRAEFEQFMNDAFYYYY